MEEMNGRTARRLVRWILLTVVTCCALINGTQAALAAPQIMYWAIADPMYPSIPQGTVTVTGYFLVDSKPVKGVHMATVWRDGKHTNFCYGVTDAKGVATCTRKAGNVPRGNTLQITATFTYRGKQYSTAMGVYPH